MDQPTPGAAGFVIIDSDGALNGANGATRPILLSEYTTTITNAQQLQLMALDPTATYTLATDIDAGATATSSNAWIGERATLSVIDGADHGFHVPIRTGGADAQVLGEMPDIASEWLTALQRADSARTARRKLPDARPWLFRDEVSID